MFVAYWKRELPVVGFLPFPLLNNLDRDVKPSREQPGEVDNISSLFNPTLPMVNNQQIKLNQINLTYQEWPPKSGCQPVLMLHGMADNSLVWLKLGDFLASQNPTYHLVAPDLRGHGNSSKPETGYFCQDYFTDLENLYQYFNWEKAHIIAHSWSAKLACLWATKYPHRCQSLVLVDPFFINSMPSIFKLTFPILYKVLPFLKLMQSFSNYEEAEKLAKGLKQFQGWTSWQEEIFKYGMEKKADGSWSSKFIKPARNEIFEDVMGEKGLTKKLDLPSLLVLPEAGLNRTSWQIKPYRDYLVNLQIAKVPGNHWAFIVEPDTFNQTIADFLASFS